MYHYILLAFLVNGTSYQYSEKYYNTQAECRNAVLEVDQQFSQRQSFCRYVESEWFPLESVLARCKEDLKIQKVTAKCIKES